jgi:hypothetical protein
VFHLKVSAFEQIKAVEAERDVLLAAEHAVTPASAAT